MPRPPLAIFLCFVGASAFAGSCTDTPGREPGDVVDNRGGDAAADARAPLDASTEGGEDAAAPLLTVLATADGFTIDNGLLSVHYDTRTGFTDYPAGGAAAPFIHDAYASVDLGTGGGGYLKSVDYVEHSFSLNDVTVVHDGFGAGVRVVVRNKAPRKPDILQIFSVYSGLRYLLLDEHVESTVPVSSNYLGALIVDSGAVSPGGAGTDPRVLDVPYDNDEWVRYDSRPLTNDFSGTGYEVAAVYDGESTPRLSGTRLRCARPREKAAHR